MRISYVTPLRIALTVAAATSGCSDPAPPVVVADAAVEILDFASDAGRSRDARPPLDLAPPSDALSSTVLCPHATDPPLASGTCAVTAGGPGLLLTGTILTPGGVLRGGQVAVDATGVITCVGCDCTAMSMGFTTVDCPTGVISPGLINPHDHITFTQNLPAPDTGERYEQRNDWRKGKRGHTKLATPGSANSDEQRWGELRFLLGGATAIVGSGGVAGLTRNLDKSGLEEAGLTNKAVDFQTFPLGDTSGIQLASGCGYVFKSTAASIASDLAFEPHIAEGIDHVANNEFLCASVSTGGGQDLTQPQSAFIHAAGLTATDYQRMAAEDVTLVWSPRSNVRLYGDTVRATVAHHLGVRFTLGTDWTASGSMNLLRELRCADSLNSNYYGGVFSDEDLWRMVTINAAHATGSLNRLGTLETGKLADIAIFDGAVRRDHRAVIAAEPADVVLVMRGGNALYGDASLVDALRPTGCEPLTVCRHPKKVCVLGDTGQSYATLEAANTNALATWYCGTPPDEPTCVPSRRASVAGSSIYSGLPSMTMMSGDGGVPLAMDGGALDSGVIDSSVGDSSAPSIDSGAPALLDSDGDGIPDTMDDCPLVFDPVRPLDDGKQPDSDHDGIGDACDPLPLTP